MLNNDHVQFATGLLKLIRVKRDNVMKVEALLIRFANGYNKIVNLIVNNRLSNWLKEVLWINTNYPVFLYSDLTDEYVGEFRKEYQVKSFWKRLVLMNKLQDVEMVLTTSSKYAEDFQGLWRFQKKSLLRDVNKFFNDGSRVFRFRRILEYK